MPATTPAVTRELADFLATTTYRDLPPAVVDDAKRATLDWFGSALAGAFEPAARMAQRVAHSLGVSDEATMLGAGRASAGAAALANGVATHILELDDVHKGSTLHAAAPVIPAALAVAERERASGNAFVLAVALGYEAALRVGEAVNPSHYRYWHPTGTAATFGAAAAAGSLMGLTPARMLDALGTAGTQAAGLWEFNADGAMSKSLHPGKAALNGILAADLAREGFTGASRILEGERGFFRAMSSSFDATRIVDELGLRWKVSENCYKLHSCCGHTHTAIDVALDARTRCGWTRESALGAIERVEIETYGPGYEIVRDANPSTPYRAKFSLTYCVAVALLEGVVGLEQFSADRFNETGVADADIAALLERASVSVRDDLTSKYPAAWPARLTIVLRDGTRQCGASDYPRGNPENQVSTELLEAKFLALVAPRYGESFASRALLLVRSLDACDDVRAAFVIPT
ncbi:MAG TPA: MmgE/PrpD family protein [Gemmatimonadaceae bacterium]|nr:MmgE/PrpD family protein [Gemmatimonadaceae bacterium]